MNSRTVARTRRTGFTIIEMVVAIGVLIVLAGLAVSVGSSIVERSEIRRTETTLGLLNAAMRQWETTAERKLTWAQWYDNRQADVNGTTAEVLIITEMLDVISRPPAVKDILAQIDEGALYTYRAGVYPSWLNTAAEQAQMDTRFDGSLTVLDAWGTPIYATHPGRTYDEILDDWYGPAVDPDGTIRTYNEEFYGVAPNRQVVFVSAGPDRKFGLPQGEFPADLSLDELQAAIEKAREDNIFSAPVTFHN